MRLTGAALLTAACLMVGLSGTNRLRRTVRRREELCRLLSMMAFELERFKTPLPELFITLQSALSGEAAELCQTMADGAGRLGACAFSQVWAEALALLPERERQILQPLGPVLGRYGAEEQTQAVTLCRREMELARDEAGAQAREKGRLYIALSAAAGAMLSVLLL